MNRIEKKSKGFTIVLSVLLFVMNCFSAFPVIAANSVTIYYLSAFSSPPFLHYAMNGSWTNLPGVQMKQSNIGEKWFEFTLEDSDATKNIQMAFNDGNNNWDSLEGKNYTSDLSTSAITVQDHLVRTGAPNISVTSPAEQPTETPIEQLEEPTPTKKPIVTPTKKPIVLKTATPRPRPSPRPIPKPTVKQTVKPTVKQTVKPTPKITHKPIAKVTIKKPLKTTPKPIQTKQPIDIVVFVPVDQSSLKVKLPTRKPLQFATPKIVVHTPTPEPVLTNESTPEPTTEPTPTDPPALMITPRPTPTPSPVPTGTPKITIVPTATPTAGPTATPKKVVNQVAFVMPTRPPAVVNQKLGGDFREETIYFILTARFNDGDPSNNDGGPLNEKSGNAANNDPMFRGDFKGLIDKLDYIKALGFTAIWLTPVLQNKSAYDYHGYHIYDFNKIDHRLESPGATYADLVKAAHEKGLKIAQDIVLNHSSPYGAVGLFTSDTGGPESLAQSPYYHKAGYINSWESEQEQWNSLTWDCPDLNTENKDVQNYLINAYNKMIDIGVDGFRIDTVKHISRNTFNRAFLPAFKKEGGDDFFMFGEAGTFVHEIWNKGVAPLSAPFYTWKERKQFSDDDTVAAHDAFIYESGLGTSNQPTSDNAFLKANEYHKPDYSKYSGLSVIDMLMHMNFSEAGNAFNKHNDDLYYNDSTWNVVYVDSHDYGPNKSNGRFSGGMDAWAENMSMMWTFRGIPTLFYGSEIEFKPGDKYPVDVGPNKPLEQTGRAYFGDHLQGNVKATDFGTFTADGEVAKTLASPLSKHLIRLNLIRRAIPALQKGQYSTSDIDGYMSFKRRFTEGKTDSFALVTISGDATFKNIPNGTYIDAVTGDTKEVTNGTLSAKCNGKANLRVYVLDLPGNPAPGKIGGDDPFLK